MHSKVVEVQIIYEDGAVENFKESFGDIIELFANEALFPYILVALVKGDQYD